MRFAQAKASKAYKLAATKFLHRSMFMPELGSTKLAEGLLRMHALV